MLEDKKEEEPQKVHSTRRGIHSEIEEILVKKLFTMVENIEVLDSGQLNFQPYSDHYLLQLEAFLEKKFNQGIFDFKEDTQVAAFLQRIKKEREHREFDL
ncbi:MAG: hypothetical protein GF308_07730 [Candidatus Heimdallarchaeota archaeon]|nr:hypothetical protein [Candidatus Heimdallarchaeota archaeon]